jgi:hypothetical protein
MATLLKNIIVNKARRDYHCDLYDQFYEYLRDGKSYVQFTQEEELIIQQARDKDWKILKGEPYRYQFIVDEGDSWQYRCIPALFDIAVKYKWFEDQ